MISKIKENVYKKMIEFANFLKGYEKRVYIAIIKISQKLTITETADLFGVCNNTVIKGLRELKCGKEIKPEVETRGRKSIEILYPNLANDIKDIIDDFSSTDPKFKTEKRYVRITVAKIRELLISEKGYTEENMSKKSALNALINKLGYNLKKVKKSQPLKKIKETNEIFENVKMVKEKYKDDNESVMISIDTKDKVKIGNYSRGGYSRIETEALDHDFECKYLSPFGILDLKSEKTKIYNTTSKVTADYIVDAIIDFWEKSEYKNKKRLVIFLDNGPENSSKRTRFIYRLALFADTYNIEIILAYYPPYHSKYNPIERVWARLENIWNGSILSTIEVCINYMNNMYWKNNKNEAYLIEKEYKIGIIESKKTMNNIEKYITRTNGIESWALTISTDN